QDRFTKLGERLRGVAFKVGQQGRVTVRECLVVVERQHSLKNSKRHGGGSGLMYPGGQLWAKVHLVPTLAAYQFFIELTCYDCVRRKLGPRDLRPVGNRGP